jgi:hypothetical protein
MGSYVADNRYWQTKKKNYTQASYNKLNVRVTKLFFSDSKVHASTGREGPEREYSYSSTLSLTSALDRVGWLTPSPGHVTPGKDPEPIVGGLQRRSGQVQKISPPPGFYPRTILPVASRYIDWAIPAPLLRQCPVEILLTRNTSFN